MAFRLIRFGVFDFLLITIKKNQDFQIVFEKGHSVSGRYTVVYFLHTSGTTVRFGYCVGKKLGTAVLRNRVRRILRQIVTTLEPTGSGGFDILIVARPLITKAKYNCIFDEIKRILSNAGLLTSP